MHPISTMYALLDQQDVQFCDICLRFLTLEMHTKGGNNSIHYRVQRIMYQAQDVFLPRNLIVFAFEVEPKKFLYARRFRRKKS